MVGLQVNYFVQLILDVRVSVVGEEIANQQNDLQMDGGMVDVGDVPV